MLLGTVTKAQTFDLRGTVYDYTNRHPIDAVSVFCTCGRGVVTDSSGQYVIRVSPKDSIYFSYLGKNTMKYPVDTISNVSAFEVGLHIDVKWLPEVKVLSHNYKFDSIQNRKDYAKVFNYKKPGLDISRSSSTYVPGSVTVGLDLDQLINMFRFRRNRQMQSFQNRLLKQEEDKYIDHRYNVPFVGELTGLQDPELETFMNIYRPDYELLQEMNDLELGYYIQLCYKDYVLRKPTQPARRGILGIE